MIKTDLEKYLKQHIPISSAMGIIADEASASKVILHAPLSNNINHKNTVFGGSLHAVATLACWSLLHINLRNHLHAPFQIVIAKSEIEYLAPVTTDFKAECHRPDELVWETFLKGANQRNKAGIKLQAKIFQDGKLCVNYNATFVALKVKGSLHQADGTST